MVDIAQRNHTRALEDLAKAIKDNTRALNNMVRHQQSLALTMQDVSTKVDAFTQLFPMGSDTSAVSTPAIDASLGSTKMKEQ